ncbi:hypothetical protein [Microbacterium sp.]|uniref:AAA family ATPase n=1 Tax=Microbacterium sp. TaxID=51671 RepID=UPI0025D7AEC0|nr:hypothetical protein [Microbacterium sp.]
MSAVIVAVDGRRGRALADELELEGAQVRLVVAPNEPAAAVADAMAGPEAAQLLGELARVDLLIVSADRSSLTAQLVAACDRFGVRIIALCLRDDQRRLARMFGVGIGEAGADAASLLATPTIAADAAPSARGRVIAVWGPAGAPGRTRVAVELACELARDGRSVALIDADSHAPSMALVTGLADEGPGFAAACRQAERGTLTVAELARIAVPLGAVEVLTGVNRPGRWPELSRERVRGALGVCREWVTDAIVDVASPLESDEEIVSDLDGPRRNAATLAVLAEADVIIAVVAADPTSVSRFVRGYGELRAVAGSTPVRVVVNKARTGALGIDARGQVRRTLERYLGVDHLWFLPWDVKAADAALLAAQPIAQVAGRSAFSAALRRFVGEAVDPPVRVRDTREGRHSRRGPSRARVTHRAA